MEFDPLTGPVEWDENEIKQLTLYKTPGSSYGFAVSYNEHMDYFEISSIQPGSEAAKQGYIQVGDKICEYLLLRLTSTMPRASAYQHTSRAKTKHTPARTHTRTHEHTFTHSRVLTSMILLSTAQWRSTGTMFPTAPTKR